MIGTAIDLSEGMLEKAKEKIQSDKVAFHIVDILKDWTFSESKYDLVTFSLMLEHIENLDHTFREAAAALKPGGHVYIGELHPFKQYNGSKARFETSEGVQVVTCFNHHITDFVNAAKNNDFELNDSSVQLKSKK